MKFQRASVGKNIGVLTWFPTHGTSMLGNNTLISGDNKGVAADLFEKEACLEPENGCSRSFVAGFSASQRGYISPNVLGAWCEDGTDQECSFRNSTCSDGASILPWSWHLFFRVKDNGASDLATKLADASFEPQHNPYTKDSIGTDISLTGSSVKSFHIFQDMSNFSFPLANGSYAHTCPAALGIPLLPVHQMGQAPLISLRPTPMHQTHHQFLESCLWSSQEPSEEQKHCHFPKPILLVCRRNYFSSTCGHQTWWMCKYCESDKLFIIVSPGESTTMAGRRWKEAIHNSAASLALSGSSVDPMS